VTSTKGMLSSPIMGIIGKVDGKFDLLNLGN